MKQKRLLVLFILLTVGTAVLAFLFSSQSGSTSQELSKGLIRWATGLFGWEPGDEAMKTLDYFVRKGAHFTLYFLLGFGLMGTFHWQKKIPPWIGAMILGTAFAASDEFHQLFTARTAMVKDVVLDAAGVAVGCLVLAFWRRRRKSKTTDQDIFSSSKVE
mgnify:CR=1 FL=1